MMLATRRRARGAVATAIGVGLLGVGFGLWGAGTARADPDATTVPGTSCTATQAADTLNAQNPAIYAKIVQYPDSAQGLADVLALTPADRALVWARWHPRDADNRQLFLGVHGWSTDERHAAEAAIDQAATTCHA